MKTSLCCRRILPTLLLIFLCTSLAQANPDENHHGMEIDSLAVMPFASADKPVDKKKSIEEFVDCKIFGLCSWKKEDNGAKIITTLYQQQLRTKIGHKVLPTGQTEAIFSELTPGKEETLRNTAKLFGKATRASHVLTGTVWRYTERVGNPMSAEKPASVGFNVMLVRTMDGVILWNENYDKTQNSLAENLLDAPMFVIKGMKWLSAEELASFGVEKTLRSFPAVTGP